MDAFDAKVDHSNTYWWITSLAMSVVCCAILFVVFAGYLFQVKEDLDMIKIRSEIVESRLKEMTLEVQILNRRSTVQQIQIIPSTSNTPSQPGAAEITPEAAAAAAAAAGNPAAAPSQPAQVLAPVPAPAKH